MAILAEILPLSGLTDVAIGAALTYGVFRKNFYAAVGLLCLYLFSIGTTIIEGGKSTVISAIFSIPFLYFYTQGIIATYKYKKILIKQREIK
jgi:hypothetical protein